MSTAATRALPRGAASRSRSSRSLASAAGPASWLLGAGLAAACLALAPRTPDLAAAAFRAQLFRDHGFLLYNSHWYGGMDNVAYSVLYPPLGALLGARLTGALATVAAVVLFERLGHGWAGERGGPAALVFAVTANFNLLIGRITFALGLALGLGALLALQRRRSGLAAALAVCCSLASPLGGLFLALAGAAWALAGVRIRRRTGVAGAALPGGRAAHWLSGARDLRAAGIVLAACAALTAALLQWAFPESGPFGFARGDLERLLIVILGVAILLPRGARALRVGALLYAVAAVIAYGVSSPLGQSVDRLATLLAAPVLLCGAWRVRPLPVLGVATAGLLWYACLPVIRDLPTAGDRSTTAAFYAPLNAFLSKHDDPPVRVEIPFTRNHWETALVARRFLLARGWERQIDVHDNPVFYRGVLTPARYLAWLRANGVGYVASPRLATEELDYYGRAEAQILGRPQPSLRLVWRDANWRVFTVLGARPLLEGPGRLLSVDPDGFRFNASRPARYTVLLHYTPYWALLGGSGCVGRSPDGWTQVDVRRGGVVRVGARFAIVRLWQHGPRCG